MGNLTSIAKVRIVEFVSYQGENYYLFDLIVSDELSIQDRNLQNMLIVRQVVPGSNPKRVVRQPSP